MAVPIQIGGSPNLVLELSSETNGGMQAGQTNMLIVNSLSFQLFSAQVILRA